MKHVKSLYCFTLNRTLTLPAVFKLQNVKTSWFWICLCSNCWSTMLFTQVVKVGEIDLTKNCTDPIERWMLICHLWTLKQGSQSQFIFCFCCLSNNICDTYTSKGFQPYLLFSKLLKRPHIFPDDCRSVIVQGTSVYIIVLVCRVVHSDNSN